MEEEFLSSVWLSLKVQVGIPLITAMLNHTSLAKDKDALSLLAHAAPVQLPLMSFVLEAAEDVLPMVDLVVNAAVTLRLMDADTTTLKSTGIVTTMMVQMKLDSLVLKSMEEELVANASLVI